ncbi:MAG: molybdenum cofactor biosynthesis protein B [Spirochaetaceae bacterium]
MRIAILTISDRASRGEYEDRSGPEIERVLEEAGLGAAEIVRDIVSDDAREIRAALERLGDGGDVAADFILTTGGTGIGPRDLTPDVTREYCERELPGIAEAIRAASLAETRTAMLSRGYAGVRGRTIVVNVPGSVRGAGFAASVIAPIMSHAVSMLDGGGH